MQGTHSNGLRLWISHITNRATSRCFSSSCRRDARAYIALGSNVGNRLGNIESACQLIDRLPATSLLRTSGLYETKAMYVLDQDPFLNGVCEIDTDLEPLDLLNNLQGIEVQLKRKKIVDKGPRTVDLDVLLYDDRTIKHDRLEVPHPLMLEREFVLRPLCDLIPSHTYQFGDDHKFSPTYASLLQSLTEKSQIEDKDHQIPASLTVLSPTTKLSSPSSESKPLVMAILNLTPDSFSDGGLHSPEDEEQIKSTLSNMLASGASIIDIGGESTRPGSKAIGAAEEMSRILPTVRLAAKLCANNNSNSNNRQAIVSVDTYRATVADAALAAGAHLINDISAGTLDAAMLPTVAKHRAAIILMHTRGSPQTMFADPALLDYGTDLVATVASELAARVAAAQAAGIPRWRILLDPGFGFAKTYAQNVELLHRLGELRDAPALLGLPWVVGVSRKRFVRGMAGYNPATHRTDEDVRTFAERGTIMALREAVKAGSEVLRVHDVALVNKLLNVGK